MASHAVAPGPPRGAIRARIAARQTPALRVLIERTGN